jgi:hypothetical protein
MSRGRGVALVCVWITGVAVGLAAGSIYVLLVSVAYGLSCFVFGCYTGKEKP